MEFKTSSFLLWLCGMILLLQGISQAQIVRKPIPDRTVVLTFDDAPASHYSHVAPLLKEKNFGATFFVCEFPPNYADSSKYMTWQQIQELDRMGFEVGNHTHTHAGVGKLPKEEVRQQIAYIEGKMNSLDMQRPLSFAYPGYSMSHAVLDVLKEKGYRMARAGGSRAYDPHSDYPYLIPSWATDDTNEQVIFDALKKAKNGKVVILTIHGVPDLEHPWVTTSPELFAKYLDFLSEHGFQVLSLRDLEVYIDFEEAARQLKPDFTKPLKN
ncbi:Peptidoglycan/xylan/chitin deacetylase, PgdA/CDA1 family [Cyclobacterium lianum]|uniref:Peptidoglycan/xylan/chitin deacetylase, PgdA/CDA1 family n=1 Tax=Cyclobacterium lianum TaxID=388280 RepID=A0A1M7M2T8_9BACT|nr:polysaccharide deacetylase family protein [Cyclobacterium lianum]SHM84513.1 Peptidoglycan/xylan/chitin deacetylase, PgdA/CDA1 family [Cyclobacterium lianum]